MINEQEFLQRRYRLQKLVAQRGASHFVATSSDSIFYLCGASFEALERPFFLIVPREGDPLTTKVLMVSFPAPWSAMPHSVPAANALLCSPQSNGMIGK